MAQSMLGILLYCRAGFEKDLANEVQEKASQRGVYGYPKCEENSAFVEFHCHSKADAEKLGKSLQLSDLIFARQLFVVLASLGDLDSEDRISPILNVMQDFPESGSVKVEHPDTSEGRELSKFCRKFTVPLRQALRKAGKLSKQDNPWLSHLQLFFSSSAQVYIGYSLLNNSSPYPMGILRLKFPHDAPSRSTLKLEEAIQLFIPEDEREKRLRPGMHGVDLGASPGGWTYQLAHRSIKVQAVDNGAMAESLMETGMVKHYAADGFRYEPRPNPVDWLICDMVEQPQRVTQLICQWLLKGWAKESIFNLKLPMKKRYESVKQAQVIIAESLNHKVKYSYQIKHLYHDREEVTVHLRVLA